jgi:hypothetical protein
MYYADGISSNGQQYVLEQCPFCEAADQNRLQTDEETWLYHV